MLHKDRYIRLGKNTFYIVSHVVGDRSTQVDLDRAVRRIRFRFYPSGDTTHTTDWNVNIDSRQWHASEPR